MSRIFRIEFRCANISLRRRTTRSTSSRSSPTPSSSNQLPSPPATRLRTRKVSAEVVVPRASTRSKGKGKQVEFSEDVKIAESAALAEESELTDLTELEEKIASGSPSPRRLRSREKRGGVSDDPESETPKQRGRSRRQTSRGEEAENCLEDEEEVDELISSPSPTPPPMRGPTPAKRRLRPRRLQTHTPPSDGGEGDDEEEADDEQVEEGMEAAEVDLSMDDEESEQSEDSRDADGDDDVYVEESTSPPPTTTPRKLRNGKVVGEECQEEATGEDEEQDGNESVDLEVEDIDIDAEGEEEEAEEIEEIDEALDGDDCWFAFSWCSMLLTLVLQSISLWPPRRPFSVCVVITLSGCARLGIWMLLVRSLNSHDHSFSGEINERASFLRPPPQAPFVHHQPFITVLMAGERLRAAAKVTPLQSSCAPIEFIKTSHALLLYQARTRPSQSQS